MTDELSEEFQILVVEDDPTHLHLITNCLKNDYRILIAKTQAKAFELLNNNHIDALLLDINLPDGNGFNICNEVKSNRSKYGDISIIFMTSEESASDEAYGLKIGANDYIRKPYNDDVLRARVDLQIKLLRRTQLLAQLVKLDGLTEIPNRRAFDEQLTKEWLRAKRDKVSLSLAMIDIDYFKQFNDTYGHPAGDKCLKKMAKCLVRTIQRSSDFYARFGGEEFAIILYGTELTDANKILKQLLQRFSNLGIKHEKSDVDSVVTFSAGVCTAQPYSDALDGFLEFTDGLLYQAKEQGRARVISAQYSK
jgi:diguanylate cyclase (GGDEF)-like protein